MPSGVAIVLQFLGGGKEQGHEPKKIGIQTANFLPAAAPGNAAPFLWGNSRGP